MDRKICLSDFHNIKIREQFYVNLSTKLDNNTLQICGHKTSIIKEVSRKMFTTFILTNILQTFFYQFDLIYRIGKKGVEIAYSQSKSYTVLQFKVILCKFRDFGKMRPQILHNLLSVLN